MTWCAINGHDEVAKTLIEGKANYDSPDLEGRTPCMWAARHGYLKIVEVLLTFGLNLNMTDKAGFTVMDHAKEHMELRSLVMCVFEANEKLLDSAMRSDTNGVAAAIEAGANLNVRDDDGWSALMWAAMHQNLDMVQLVVRHGANPDLLDANGQTLEALSPSHLSVGEAL